MNLASGQGASVREVVDNASAVTGVAIDARDTAPTWGSIIALSEHAP